MSTGTDRKLALHNLRPEQAVTALAVSSDDGALAFLREVFGEAGWTLHETRTVTDGLMLFKRRPLDIIITDRELPDGCWRGLLDALKPLATPPPLIVTSRLADEYLWAEVLNEGGYDVLAQPFDAEEVIRVISAATRRTHNASRQAARMPMLLSAGA